MEPVLRIENITKKFDRDTVLNGASFSLAQKEILCILGKNASAKSTLVRILSGALTPDGGNIYIDGVKRRISNIWKASRFGIFTIFEDHKLFEQLSLPENIFFGSYHSPGNHTSLGVVRNKNLLDAAASIIEQFSLPFSADTPVSSLSPAEARLVLLLRAYVHKSRVIIIDSCFSSLDDGEAELLCRVLLQLRDCGASILLTTQMERHMERVADSVTIMDKGHLSAKTPISQFQMSDFTGTSGTFAYPKLHRPQPSVAYSFRNLCYADQLIDVSFDVYHGEIIGFLGAHDSGKNELIRVLTGDCPADIGLFYRQGREFRNTSPKNAKRNGISAILNDSNSFGLIPYMDIPMNIALPDLDKFSHGKIVDGRKIRTHASHIVERLAIEHPRNTRHVRHLSAGNKQKISFGRSISSATDLYVLDDLTASVDSIGKVHIYNIMDALSRDGKSLLLFTSDIDEALGMCDRIFVLKHGKIVCEFGNGFDFDASAIISSI